MPKENIELLADYFKRNKDQNLVNYIDFLNNVDEFDYQHFKRSKDLY